MRFDVRFLFLCDHDRWFNSCETKQFYQSVCVHPKVIVNSIVFCFNCVWRQIWLPRFFWQLTHQCKQMIFVYQKQYIALFAYMYDTWIWNYLFHYFYFGDFFIAFISMFSSFSTFSHQFPSDLLISYYLTSIFLQFSHLHVNAKYCWTRGETRKKSKMQLIVEYRKWNLCRTTDIQIEICNDRNVYDKNTRERRRRGVGNSRKVKTGFWLNYWFWRLLYSVVIAIVIYIFFAAFDTILYPMDFYLQSCCLLFIYLFFWLKHSVNNDQQREEKNALCGTRQKISTQILFISAEKSSVSYCTVDIMKKKNQWHWY